MFIDQSPDFAKVKDPASFFIVGRVNSRNSNREQTLLRFQGLQVGMGRTTWPECWT